MVQVALLPRQRFSDPENFVAYMATASPGTRARPLTRHDFQVELSLALLPRVALFSAETKNFWAARTATGDIWSVTIPVSGGFSAATGATRHLRAFQRNECYVLHPDRDFDYRVRGTSRVLVANILSLDLGRKVRALAGGRAQKLAEKVSSHGPAGGLLVRFAHHFWTELQRPQGLWACPTAMAEMEDCLVSLLALAASTPDPDGDTTAHVGTVRRAEDFLIQHLFKPVTRSEVARAAGVSISTLSRGFRAHHGVGPMAWLKGRRLEAAHRELQAAAPGEVTVTEVALRYGFEHLGRFATEYFRTFGENPSRTLQR